jgi:hypothetical protein
MMVSLDWSISRGRNPRFLWVDSLILRSRKRRKTDGTERRSFRFSFGPWNIHEGADVFGPAVRATRPFSEKLAVYRSLGFEGIQFHDDDAVPSVDVPHEQMIKEAREMKKIVDGEGLIPEFCRATSLGASSHHRWRLHVKRSEGTGVTPGIGHGKRLISPNEIRNAQPRALARSGRRVCQRVQGPRGGDGAICRSSR